MGGLGFTEILFIAGTIALLFGPGAVLVWWFMTQSRVRSTPAEDDAADSEAHAASGESSDSSDEPVPDPVLAAAARSLADGAITQEQYDEIERTLS